MSEVQRGDHVHGTIGTGKVCGVVTVVDKRKHPGYVYLETGQAMKIADITMVDSTTREQSDGIVAAMIPGKANLS